MFEQHEREEIARMELSNLRRQVENQSCVIAELKAKSSSERQAQHEATWAMAMEAAAKHVENGIDRPVGTPWNKDRTPSKHDKCIHGIWMYDDCEQCVPSSIRAIPCPTLQTTNEESEK